jgi:glycerol-3-phosphate acyltransferase PlsX
LREKPDDSMNRCAQLVKQGRADAMVLCGNTGCSVSAAQLHLRRVPGVKRAGILTPMPTPKGITWLCDGGANTVCRPEWLAQFAEMTVALLESVYGKSRPVVGVLSNGEEEEKGTELTQQTLELLRKTTLNCKGYVEGHDIFSGEIDVVVCDGFLGNVVLKTAEGLVDGAMRIIREETGKGFFTKMGGLLMRPAFRGFKRRTHWSLVGGCPLIGVDGVCIIGHGRSNAIAVYHALEQAARCVSGKFIQRLRQHYQSQATDPAAA